MRGRMIAGAALIAVGLVWIGQGLGVLSGSSFMVGDATWAVAGVVAAVVGAVVVISGRRGSRPDA